MKIFYYVGYNGPIELDYLPTLYPIFGSGEAYYYFYSGVSAEPYLKQDKCFVTEFQYDDGDMYLIVPENF